MVKLTITMDCEPMIEQELTSYLEEKIAGIKDDTTILELPVKTMSYVRIKES